MVMKKKTKVMGKFVMTTEFNDDAGRCGREEANTAISQQGDGRRGTASGVRVAAQAYQCEAGFAQ